MENDNWNLKTVWNSEGFELVAEHPDKRRFVFQLDMLFQGHPGYEKSVEWEQVPEELKELVEYEVIQLTETLTLFLERYFNKRI